MRPLHETSASVKFRLHGSDDLIETWPTSCSELCWHCRHTFPSPPASIPMQYDHANGTWHMKGIFCSFSCAKRHVLEMGLFNVASILLSMKKVASLFGVTGRIVAAPPLYALKSFGGYMDVEEFRKSAHPIVGCTYPFFNYGMGIHAHVEEGEKVVGLRRQPAQRAIKRTKNTGMYEKFLKGNKKRKVVTTKKTGGMSNFMKKKRKI
jgi:hypothetical protein